MNDSIWRKIIGDIKTRKGRTALVAISIFIGVLGVVTLITAGDLLVRQLTADIRQEELPMLASFVVIPGDPPANLDNQAVLATLAELPGVTVVEGQANYPLFWRLPGETRFREMRIQAYTQPFGEIRLAPPRLIEGRYPRAGQHELALEVRLAEDFDLDVGDTVEVRILSNPQELPTEAWTVSGLLFDAYNQQPDKTLYATYDDARYMAGFAGLSSIYARFTDYPTAEQSIETFGATITDRTPYITFFQFAEDPAKNSAIESTKQYAAVLAALAIVAMLVSGFLVINVINNLVVEQKRQIGVMKSLGALRYETFMIYAGIALIYGVLGMVPGVLLGIPLGYKMAVIVGDFAGTLITGFKVSPPAIVLGIVLGLAVPVLSAAIPVYNGTRVTILEAMTDLGISGGYKVGPIARLIRRLPLPIQIKQSLNNINQKKARLALTVVTLALAVTAFMGVSAVFVRINQVLNEILDTFAFEVQVQPTQSQALEDIEPLILDNVPAVEKVYPGTALSVQIDGYLSQFTNTSQLILSGLDTTAPLLTLELTEGDAWNNDPDREGIVLTTEVARQLGKHVGDTVTIRNGGKQLELEIIGIANFPFDLGFMEWRQLARFAGYVRGAPRPNTFFSQVTLDGYQGALDDGAVLAWGVNEELLTLVDFQGFVPVAQDQPSVAISAGLAQRAGLKPGDTVTLAFAQHRGPFTVAAIFTPKEAALALAEQAGLDDPQSLRSADLVALSWEDLARYEGVSLEGEPIPNAFALVLRERNLSARQVDRIIEEVNQVLVEHGITSSFVNMVEIADQASDVILSIGIILNMASLVMAAVGAIGLLTTLSISVFERQKEIGVMRSVGADSWQIIVQFLVEGLVVGVIAWLIAAPLSVVLAYTLTDLLPFGQFIEFAYPVWMFAVGLGGILIIAALSSIWPSVAASRKTVSDILRYQ
jgi:putative ABC transport system permease protein